MSTYKYWKKLTSKEIQNRVFEALDKNVNYRQENILGIPASHLDEKVFSQDESFLKNAPFISTMVQNPNHIGCHTLGTSEPFFAGTQSIEQEVIEICATDILRASPQSCDGYIASGGTEANIQAIWMYRNYFQNEYQAKTTEIGILCSVDSHYSMDKAANLLGISIHKVQVDANTRTLSSIAIDEALSKAKSSGIKHFIVVANMMTTMYGSVDDVSLYVNALLADDISFKLHVDGAYGGFYYPFAHKEHHLDFANKHVSSVTLDAHKMAQAPYGTGIFIAHKGLIHYTNTKASYVEGDDYTLIGSRSGANAVAVWMILMTHGPYGWYEKVFVLQKRTEWMCDKLTEKGVQYYRNKGANIITIKASELSDEVAHLYGLVPDNHANPTWYKIVIMDHVTVEKLMLLLEDM
ncbi:MAG TPA: aspartate aminotransferase family protein [Bacteroidetes bacterium]|nr:aspartate aminotransferase family protein [Bacteroidota bacterium]